MRERNIENEILKQNKIPGCDQLTRPEEVKALSKYLKSIRTTQENHTFLEKDNLELPGRTTGRIPEINSLEDHVEGLDGIRGVKNLYKESSRISLSDDQGEKIPTGLYTEKSRENLEDKRKISLENKREDLKNTLEDPKLEKHRENLDTDSSGIDELNKEKVNLEGVRDVRNLYINTKEKLKVPEEDLILGKEKESLIDNHNPELDLTRIDLEGFRDLSYKEQLEVDSKNELDTTRISLKKTTENPELSNHKEDLKKTPEELDKLGSYKESLGNIEDKLEELNGTKIKLRNPVSDIELSKTKVSLERTAEDKELETYRENLKKTPEELDKLGSYKESLGNIEDKLEELNGTKIKLRNPVSDIELSKTKVSLERTAEDKELETYRENLKKTPEELDKLENHKESLRSGEELENLPKDKIALEGIAETLEELGNTRIDLDGTEESEISTLEDYRENLSVEDNNSLEDERIDLGGTVDYETFELEDTRISLTGTEEFEPGSLEDKRIDLEDTKESEPKALEDERIDLNGTKESEISTLEDYRENLSVEDNNSLEDTRIDLTGTKEAEVSELEDYLDELDNTKDYEASELEDTRIDLTGTKEAEPESLEDKRIDLEDTEEYESSSLEDERINLESTEEFEPGSLEDFIDKLEDSRDTELEDEILELPETSGDEYEGYNPLGPDELDSLGGNINNFYDSLLEVPETGDAPRQSGDYTPLGPEELDSLGGDLGNFYDSILEVPEDTEHIIEELNDDIKEKIPEAQVDESQKDWKYLKELTEDDLYKETIRLLSEKEAGEWGKKMQSLVSAYLSSEAISPDRAEEYINKLGKEILIQQESSRVEGPSMKLPKFGLESLNLSNYLRWTAEKTIGWTGVHGSARQLLLNETIAALVVARDELEKLSKSNRYRLPGNDGGLLGDLVSGGVSGALDNLGDKLGDAVNTIVGSKSVDISNPINRPEKNEHRDGWEEGNIRPSGSNPFLPTQSHSEFSQKEGNLLSKITKSSGSSGDSNKFWKKVGSAAKDMLLGSSSGETTYKFKSNYVSGKGINITLEELCGISGTDDANTVEGLYNVLKSSPFITTPDKFTSTGYSDYRTQTLDTNAYWEVVLEPYVGPENGNLNYLPGIHEINTRNIAQHGVNTAYNRWIPYVSFDLQKSKLTNKTLNLYDGEISYPVSMEFTNEFRLTIADDQYKSWRRYFEECAKAAIYNSEGHDESYYKEGGTEGVLGLTAIDTNNVCIAMYKNICFRCRIYVMTPQYSTIQKFDLLLVMKDFSEEYTGDIGDGAGDLTVSFSIVGENPNEGEIPKVKVIQHKAPDNSSKTDYGSIVESGVNSVMKLIK